MRNESPASFGRKKCTRREFFSLAGKFAAGGALAFLAMRLFQKTAPPGSASCVNNYVCRNCGRVSSCIFPQAQSCRLKMGIPKAPGEKRG